MYIPFQVHRCHRSILLIVQYKYLKSCSEKKSSEQDFILKTPTKIRFSAQDHAVLLLLLNIVGFFISARQKSALWKWFVPQLYQHRRGILEGPALKYFYKIHRGGRILQYSTLMYSTDTMHCMYSSASHVLYSILHFVYSSVLYTYVFYRYHALFVQFCISCILQYSTFCVSYNILHSMYSTDINHCMYSYASHVLYSILNIEYSTLFYTYVFYRYQSLYVQLRISCTLQYSPYPLFHSILHLYILQIWGGGYS